MLLIENWLPSVALIFAAVTFMIGCIVIIKLLKIKTLQDFYNVDVEDFAAGIFISVAASIVVGLIHWVLVNFILPILVAFCLLFLLSFGIITLFNKLPKQSSKGADNGENNSSN